VLTKNNYSNAVTNIKSQLIEFKPGDKIFDVIVPKRNLVFTKYRPAFDAKNISKLSREDFISFLSFKNNCHWTGLERKGRNAATDIEILRSALSILLNENIPIQERIPQATGMVMGMGKAIATSILLVAHPSKYGVWNGTSELALKKLSIFPTERLGIGEKYRVINDTLNRLSTDLAIDLWTLDALWWRYIKT
jgi:hypothetical protein